MKQPVAIVNNDFDDFLTVDFMVTNKCNFSCHYCHPGSNEGNIGFPEDFDLLLENLGHAIKIYKEHFNKKHIKFEITGGEPTVWPKIGEFARWLKNEQGIDNVFLVTNGSRTMRWWEQYAGYFDEVHLSLHSVEGNPHHIIQVADYIYENHKNTHVAVNVLMDPLNWQRSIDNMEIVVNHPSTWLVKSWALVKDGRLRDDYTKEQLEMFRDKVLKKPPEEYIQRMIDNNIIPKKTTAKIVFDDGTIDGYNSFMLRENQLHNYQGWLCNLGVDRISFLGSWILGSCGASNLFNLESPLSLNDKEFTKKFTPEIIKPIICRQLSCGSCTKDLKVPKAMIHKKHD